MYTQMMVVNSDNNCINLSRVPSDIINYLLFSIMEVYQLLINVDNHIDNHQIKNSNSRSQYL
jgi:hypothetical protein